ncbi:MAG: GNAT family N-acetyltransferase [Clostridia bacterium]|nr:GNAT family N-acetyltransferase [Clostridia bacterium]
MKLIRYENQACNIDPEILKRDEFCFSVLARILQGECKLTITDHKRLIICFSCEPYPVWVWLAEDATDAELELAYTTVRDNFPIGENCRINLKHELSEFFINRARADGYQLKITMNLLTYSCPSPIAPRRIVDGECRVATLDDLKATVQYMHDFRIDVGADQTDMNTYEKRARELIDDGRLFFWCDENGERVAMTSYGISSGKGSLSNVYTLPDKRRRGYASNLAYAVTLIIKSSGYLPVLYADADYVASNACYESIGYIKMGGLCTIGCPS